MIFFYITSGPDSVFGQVVKFCESVSFTVRLWDFETSVSLLLSNSQNFMPCHVHCTK